MASQLNIIIKNRYFQACVVLIILLNIFFFPVIWGNKTLMTSVRDVPSIMPQGAYGPAQPSKLFDRTADYGAPGWQTEPWYKIIYNQYHQEHNLPLWNPYNAFGTPLLAESQPQPFYPLSFLLTLHPTMRTYDLFIITRLFIAGLFTFLLLSLFIKKEPALFGTIAYMFSGYLILYINMEHLSVDILVPAVLYFFELMLRRKDLKAIIGCALIIFIAIMGGGPESAFLILSFGFIYAIFRIVIDHSLRIDGWIHAKNFIVAAIFGFALSAFYLIPFIEFMKISYDSHQFGNTGVITGISHDTDFKTSITYLVPLILGPLQAPVLGTGVSNLIRGYWGITPFIFALLAVVAYFRIKIKDGMNRQNMLVIFFTLTAILLVMKRFGFSIINWIGYLPVANMVIFVKYQETILGFAVAVLCGIGFSYLFEHRINKKYLISAIVLASGILILLCAAWLPTADNVVFGGDHVSVSVLKLLRAEAAPAENLNSRGAIDTPKDGQTVGGTVNVAGWYLDGNGVSKIDVLVDGILKGQASYGDARPDLLKGYPGYNNGNGGYHYALDALHIPKGQHTIQVRETGLNGSQSTKQINIHVFNTWLAYIKYYIFYVSIATSLILIMVIALILLLYYKKKDLQKVLQAILFAILIAELFFSFFFPCFIYRNALPDRTTNPYNGAPYITFLQNRNGDYSRVFGRNSVLYPDWSGVFGIQDVRLLDAMLYKKYILFVRSMLLPAQVPGQVSEDLYDRFTGDGYNYSFNTLSEKRFLQLSSVKYILTMDPYPQDQFQKIYDREIKIYEYDDVIPRASVFYGATLVNNDNRALSLLKDPSFNIFQKVVVSSSSLSNKDAIFLETLEHAPARNLDAAKIVSYQSQKVDIEANLQQPGLLMLNDSNYPGWKVYVDGHESHIMDVDYLFRGVLLDSGKHQVEFRYQPRSFYIGLMITFITIICMVILLLLSKLKLIPLKRKGD